MNFFITNQCNQKILRRVDFVLRAQDCGLSSGDALIDFSIPESPVDLDLGPRNRIGETNLFIAVQIHERAYGHSPSFLLSTKRELVEFTYKKRKSASPFDAEKTDVLIQINRIE